MTAYQEVDEETLKSQQHIYESNVLDEKSDTSYKSLIMTFIRQLRPGMDVTKIQAPIYILKPRSFLEMTSEYVHPTEALIRVGSDPDPESRMLTIVAWCLSNLSGTAQKGFSRMKPYNPILGEKYFCTFEHADSTTDFRAEQVSHHPPISALVMENRKHNIVYTSTTLPKSTFWGNKVDMAIEGEHSLHLLNLDERYTVEFPPIVARGIILGSSVVEHNGNMILACEKTGYRAEIEFKKKQLNFVEGHIFKDGEKIFKICGTLDKSIPAVNVKTKEEVLMYDPSLIKSVKRIVRPVHEQGKNESQRVWHAVTHALAINDLDSAATHKHLLEEWQRKVRRERADRGEEWKADEFIPTGEMTKNGIPIYRYIKEILVATNENTVEEEFDEDDLD